MTLYEIDNAFLECIDPESGDVIDIDRLEALEAERDKKISNIACWIKNLDAEAKALKEEKTNLANRQRITENKAESLREFLKNYLNGAKYKDSKVSISYRKSTSTEFDDDLDLNKLPEEYKKVTIEPSKSAIKEALQNGEEIKGCHLVENNNMIIR